MMTDCRLHLFEDPPPVDCIAGAGGLRCMSEPGLGGFEAMKTGRSRQSSAEMGWTGARPGQRSGNDAPGLLVEQGHVTSVYDPGPSVLVHPPGQDVECKQGGALATPVVVRTGV